MIAFAIFGVLALVALGMDGGQAFADRRQAQNAVDSAAYAVALKYQQVPTTSFSALQDIAWASALANGYPHDNIRSSVTLDDPADVTGLCPGGKNGKDFTITLVSNLNTWFAPIVGISQVHNTVTATARGCEWHYAPYFNGDTIVGLAPKPNTGYLMNGGADLKLECDGTEAGGLFVNGNAEKKGGSGEVYSPSMTIVGSGESAFDSTHIADVTTDPAAALSYPGDILSLMPPTPACNGTATLVGGIWTPETGKDGSKVYNWNGGQTYAAGVFCVESVAHPWSGVLSAPNGSTFFIRVPDLDMKLAGSGDAMNITAPSGTSTYAGYAIVLPFTCTGGVLCDMNQVKAGTQTVDPCTSNSDTPTLDLRGNGATGISGAVWMPTACLTLLGNSGSTNHGQIVAYSVQTGGTADVSVCYKAPENPQEVFPPTIDLIK